MVLTALVAPPRRMTELTAHKPQHINTTTLALACREHPLPRRVRDDARLRTPQPTQDFAEVRQKKTFGRMFLFKMVTSFPVPSSPT